MVILPMLISLVISLFRSYADTLFPWRLQSWVIDSFLLGELSRKLSISDWTMDSWGDSFRKFFRNWVECLTMVSAWSRFLVDISFCFSMAARMVAILWAMDMDRANMGLSCAVVSSISFIFNVISLGVWMSDGVMLFTILVSVEDMILIWLRDRGSACFFDRME